MKKSIEKGFYNNGKLLYLFNYLNGQLHGTQKYYNEDGTYFIKHYWKGKIITKEALNKKFIDILKD